MNVSVLGCGRWGSFIAWYLNKIGCKTTLWGRGSSQRYQRLAAERATGLIAFDESVRITSDLSLAAAEGDTLVISISSQSLREFMGTLSKLPLAGKSLVLCMKGIEESTGLRLTQIIKEFTDCPAAVWVGPGHVQDFAAGIPNCMVIDSEDESLKRELVHAFSSDLIRFYFGTDLIGSEVGAAAKNVVGIAAGMLDGLNQSSLKGALMSRGTREIARLIEAMGGSGNSAYGLCHLGDYQATLFSEHSHNRRFGELFLLGKPYGELAEGVSTVRALCLLGEQYQVDLPICKAINAVIHEKKEPRQVLSQLFMRSLKDEF